VLARFLLWRLLGIAAAVAGVALLLWLAHGGLGGLIRGSEPHRRATEAARAWAGARTVEPPLHWSRPARSAVVPLCLGLLTAVVSLLGLRLRGRRRRRYVRLRVAPYRTDGTSVEGLVAMFESLHKRLSQRWWRRLLKGQPSIALEVHCRHRRDGLGQAWLGLVCPVGLERMVEASLRAAYPNCALEQARHPPLRVPPVVLRLKKRSQFIKRVKLLDRFELAREPPIDRLITTMGACRRDAFVQLALTPTPASFERYARRLYKRYEARLSRERREHLLLRDRSLLEDSELRGGLQVQHRPLFFADLRVASATRATCEQIASELLAEGAENRLVQRGASPRGWSGSYRRRVQRGEGNLCPDPVKGVLASTELAALWHLPSIGYATVPLARRALPVAPAPPAIARPRAGAGTLRDAFGPVCIEPDLRRQNTAVPGAVEQGKTSYLVATVAEDLRRERCAVILFDPKGDAAEAAVGLVPTDRTCTVLDFAHPTCGFNPLATQAPADTIADYVVGALRNLFTDADIRASSDRYLRNAVIAVLAHDRAASLWDAARLLSVGEEGYAYRARVGAHVRTLPEFKEIAEFFTAELAAQLADSRSTTTAKLDAPVNKLARLLNSPSIKRVLLNDSLRIDFDRVIAAGEVLVVKGALGAMGAGNTSVLMQLLIGMLDAALARQQDLLPSAERVAVALKIDEAPLVVTRGFAQTLALKRSAGLETVACWQTDAQWADREIRDQLDALFAHRVYFATASATDARTAASLLMTEFADTVRPGIGGLLALARPDARLHLPRHHAIVSWVTADGRQPPFLARTTPLAADRERVAFHAARQALRGGRYRSDLSQPHWERRDSAATTARAPSSRAPTDVPVPDAGPPLPPTAAESYRELVELDAAHTVRPVAGPSVAAPLDPDQLDIEVLKLLAALRHLLSSQIHRRFNDGRSITTTQRRLKRLADAGLVDRFQFHRRDGGGVPMCYAISAAGRALLAARERSPHATRPADPTVEESRRPRAATDDAQLRQARRDIHVAGWVLALERALGGAPLRLRGPVESVLSPPLRSTPAGRVAIGPRELRLPGGRSAHGFMRSQPDGARLEVQRFETVRPDAAASVPISPARTRGTPGSRVGAESSSSVELLIERDDRLPRGPGATKLERYDHLLAGWALSIPSLARPGILRLAIFVCRDRARARDCADAADAVLGACRAYAGEHPRDWEYPGRAATLFVAERDVHEGHLFAYGVDPLPPDVRGAAQAPSGASRGREATRAAARPLEIPLPRRVVGAPGRSGA
jgi:DNA-binding transcriptional ArsR family regulator